jgi:hypothetical protein
MSTARSGKFGGRRRPAPVVFEAQKDEDGVPFNKTEAMARGRRRGFPGTEVGCDWRLMVGRDGPGHGYEQCR